MIIRAKSKISFRVFYNDGMPRRKSSQPAEPKRNIIGKRVRRARLHASPRVSQEDLAARVRAYGVVMTQEMVSKIERGLRPVLDYELKAIASSLAVGIAWLVDEEETFRDATGPEERRGRKKAMP